MPTILSRPRKKLRTAVVRAWCVPHKFNQGNFTCELSYTASTASAETSQPQLTQTPEGGAAELYPAVSSPSITNTKRQATAEDAEDVSLKKLRKVWTSLIPDVFGCTASVAGSDFSFYYLATYNLSVDPKPQHALVGALSELWVPAQNLRAVPLSNIQPRIVKMKLYRARV